jgi:hypothetical protein
MTSEPTGAALRAGSLDGSLRPFAVVISARIDARFRAVKPISRSHGTAASARTSVFPETTFVGARPALLSCSPFASTYPSALRMRRGQLRSVRTVDGTSKSRSSAIRSGVGNRGAACVRATC